MRNVFDRIIDAAEADEGITLSDTDVGVLMNHCASAIDEAASNSRGFGTIDGDEELDERDPED